jgi:hypothetical protein
MRYPLFVLVCALVLLGGCQSKQVRHLASDAALIQPGRTTVQEMQKYLGEPDGRREVAPGVSEYVYHEDRPGLFGYMPVLGPAIGPAGYEMIVVTVSDDIVSNCEFRNFNQLDRRWRDDYTWDHEVQ